MRRLRYVLCDVFTDTPLTGNPLAVFTNAIDLDPTTMQAIAREMNLSETVFLLPPTLGGHARLRIFTPGRELPFAGHPVLGTAFVVGESVPLPELDLETGRGPVRVSLTREGARPTFGWMRQPLPSIATFAEAPVMLAALGVKQAALPIEVYDNGPRHVLVGLDARSTLQALRPDFNALGAFAEGSIAFAGGDGSFFVRAFHPSVGVNEDPATGSAAGPLVVHLVRHGRAAFGDEIRIDQGGEIGRPSVLYARARGTSAGLEAVEVGGSAVVIGRGELRL